jgi:hypothetical protein
MGRRFAYLHHVVEPKRINDPSGALNVPPGSLIQITGLTAGLDSPAAEPALAFSSCCQNLRRVAATTDENARAAPIITGGRFATYALSTGITTSFLRRNHGVHGGSYRA